MMFPAKSLIYIVRILALPLPPKWTKTRTGWTVMSLFCISDRLPSMQQICGPPQNYTISLWGRRNDLLSRWNLRRRFTYLDILSTTLYLSLDCGRISHPSEDISLSRTKDEKNILSVMQNSHGNQTIHIRSIQIRPRKPHCLNRRKTQQSNTKN